MRTLGGFGLGCAIGGAMWAVMLFALGRFWGWW